MRAKKIIGWTATALFFCAFVTMVVLVGINWDKITSGTTLYTVSDLKEEYNKGVNAGLEQGEEWRVLYEKVLVDLSDAEENQSILTARLNSERANNEQLESEKAVLTVELSQTKEELATALLQNETDADTISQLQARVSELELQLEEKELALVTNNETIASLEADKLALQNEVTRLTALLAGYEEIANSTLTADFYIGDTLYTTKVVKSGQAVAGLENPVDTNDYRFDGWSIDGTTPVDVASYELEENTVFRALLTEKHEVRFVVDNVVVDTQYILDDEFATGYPISSTEDRDFDGWAVNDEIVDIGIYSISADTIFVAKLTNVYDINFVANGEKVATYKVRDGELIPEVETPTLEGGEFRGWYVEDPTAYIDLATYVAKSDITLTAYFATWRTILTSQKITSASQTLSIDIKAGEIFRVTYSNFAYTTNTMAMMYMGTSVKADGTILLGGDVNATKAAAAVTKPTLTITSGLNNGWQSAGSYGESYNLLETKDHVLQGVDFVCNEDGKLSINSYCFYYFKNSTKKTSNFYSLTINSIEVLR